KGNIYCKQQGLCASVITTRQHWLTSTCHRLCGSLCTQSGRLPCTYAKHTPCREHRPTLTILCRPLRTSFTTKNCRNYTGQQHRRRSARCGHLDIANIGHKI